tara:strand:- start:13 stop:351 length:339 start_codon:yes stop_codon:yes gene_type:complete
MVKIKLNLFLFFIFSLSFVSNSFANSNMDQWEDSEKTYKDLISDGFEVKAYDMTTIETNSGFKILMFVTVLQKNQIVYECQEYQTIDDSMSTLDLSIVCRELVQPYEYGVDT